MRGLASALIVLVSLSGGSWAGDGSVIEGVDYPDDAAARAAWKPMGATAPVSVVEKDGVRALKMPCNFKGTKIDRASWDLAVQQDLSFCQGLQFRFYCTDLSPISGFSFYMQSGNGWYSAGFAPVQQGGWCTVTIDKAATSLEGAPAGWGNIRTIRVSAWRAGETDTELYLADLRVVGRDAPIVVLRGDSVARANANEANSVQTFAQAVTQCLTDLRLPHLMVSDLDPVEAALKGRKLIILPHNASMPDEAAKAVTNFLKSGGKAIIFFAIPGQLEEPTGIARGVYVRQKSPGFFSRIRFANPLPAGMPAEVRQQSWNIFDSKPAAGRGRVAAEWFDQDGKPTGHSAVVRTDNCYLMTHVLLNDDPSGKRRMLLAMAGDLVPDLWKEAAADLASRIGQIGTFTDFESARKGITELAKGKPEALAALEKSAARRDEALSLAKAGKYPESMAKAEEAREALVESYCRAQSAAPNEQRGIWCHSAYGAAGMEWDEAIRVLAENGFNAVFPNMLWGGNADYESSVLPVSPRVKEVGDPLVKCLAACRKYGVQCHVWKVNWNTGGHAPKEFLEKMKQEGRTQVLFDGTAGDAWLCPSHLENRKLECAAMLEVATKYDVDGIHFDYIRYNGNDGCFCAGCRQRFEEKIGRKIANWPKDVRADKAIQAQWLDFRREQITALVQMVSEQVRKARPKVKISAAVFPNWTVDRDSIGQDWKLWCERGYVDFVCPMTYTEHDSVFESLVAKQKEWAGSKACYPGIGLTVWKPSDDVVNLIGKIRIARRLGLPGFTVFDYTPASSRAVIERCGLGITKAK